MKLLTFAALFACASPALAETAKVTATPAAAISWADSGFGPQVSNVVGDMTTGTHVTFIRFPAGMVSPLHIHSADYTGVVVTGVTRHYEPGQRETSPDLPAGSTWAVPANLPHVSECLPGAECIMMIYQTAGFDILPQ